MWRWALTGFVWEITACVTTSKGDKFISTGFAIGESRIGKIEL
jgi:hypothetical protein